MNSTHVILYNVIIYQTLGVLSLRGQDEEYINDIMQINNSEETFERGVTPAQIEIENEIARTRNLLSIMKAFLLPRWVTNHFTQFWSIKEEIDIKRSTNKEQYEQSVDGKVYDNSEMIHEYLDLKEEDNETCEDSKESTLKTVKIIWNKISNYTIISIMQKYTWSRSKTNINTDTI